MRTHRFEGDRELEVSMMSMADLAASELGASWMTGRPPRILPGRRVEGLRP